MDYAGYHQHDAVALAGLVAGGATDPAELLDVALARCAEVDPKINAVSLLMEDSARVRAGGPLRGALAGVPFLIKDLLQDHAGYPTAAGVGALRGVVATRSSVVVERWLDAGLVIFGKTTTPEFGTKAITESPTFGATRNPWDLARTPGGSSGGAAAAVAAGIVPVAGASDGGGSIRVPAACCGLVGLKAGRGLVPCGPAHGELIHGAATEGVVSRTVRDSAVMLDILTTPRDAGAPYLAARPERSYVEAIALAPRRLRIGFTAESPIGTPVHDEAVAAAGDAAALLESLGHHVEPAAPAIDGPQLAEDFMMVWATYVAAALDDACRTTGARPRAFDRDTQALAAAGRAPNAMRYAQALERWNTYTRQLAAFHDTYDLLLTPTLAQPPIAIGALELPALQRTAMDVLLRLGLGGRVLRTRVGRDAVTAGLAPVPFTQLANVTGRPAISLPTYRTPAGLPLGTQLVGGLGAEALLLQVGAEIEAARPWDREWPTL